MHVRFAMNFQLPITGVLPTRQVLAQLNPTPNLLLLLTAILYHSIPATLV